MFGFCKKYSLLELGVLTGFSDCHAHLLWGIDDGISSREETLATLAYYEQIGIRTVYLTPHVMADYPHNTKRNLEQAFRTLQEQYTGSVALFLGAEYLLDADFEALLDADELLVQPGNRVLLETSYLNKPLGFEALLHKVQTRGYSILLAHPERYSYMLWPEYEHLKSQGIQFQLNLLSLVGSYGRGVAVQAQKLLQAGFYDYAGTDLHNLDFHQKEFHRKAISRKEGELLAALCGSVPVGISQ